MLEIFDNLYPVITEFVILRFRLSYILEIAYIAVLKRGEVCPMPYALCPMPYARRVPHVTEKSYILAPITNISIW